MKFKIGDRVRITSNGGGGKIFNHYDIGDVVKIIDTGRENFLCKREQGGMEQYVHPSCFEPVKESKFKESKFKVGDKVIGNKRAGKEYCITGEGYIGEVDEIRSDGKINMNGFIVDPDCFDLYEDKEKGWRIEIVPNGEETTATLYKRGKAVKSATVKRYKGDEYSIADAADYAVQKLFEKNKKKEFKIGARVVGVGEFEGRNIDRYKGTIREVSFDGGRFGVEFDKDMRGHDIGMYGHRCKNGHGWYCPKEYLKLI
jgi:hypothetical protein